MEKLVVVVDAIDADVVAAIVDAAVNVARVVENPEVVTDAVIAEKLASCVEVVAAVVSATVAAVVLVVTPIVVIVAIVVDTSEVMPSGDT